MFKPFTPPELNPVAAGAAMALVVVAVFAWAQSGSVVIPDRDVGSPWPWRGWQLGAIVIAGAGLWMLSGCTRRASQTCCLALALYALAVFVNAYTPGFGDYDGAVWRTVNALFIAFTVLTVPSLWRCGCAPGYVAAALMAVFGVVVLVNAYFVNEGVIWRIMNPLMMLSALAWAAGIAQYAGHDATETGE